MLPLYHCVRVYVYACMRAGMRVYARKHEKKNGEKKEKR